MFARCWSVGDGKTLAPFREDLTWLQEFSERIWPEIGRSTRGYFWDVEPITHEELIKLCEVIERNDFVVHLWTYGPLGGIGMSLIQHEVYPGTGPEEVFRIKDEHIPEGSRTWHERLLGVSEKKVESRGQGCIRQDVWELFSQFSHTKQNRQWLTKYKLKMHFEPGHYDY